MHLGHAQGLGESRRNKARSICSIWNYTLVPRWEMESWTEGSEGKGAAEIQSSDSQNKVTDLRLSQGDGENASALRLLHYECAQ